ncbi:E3 ubiquitin ligase BIG BROTHER-related-like protein isoform X1 [Cinnamomum micranthum f. kanehirae]|uniref:E3 ubiquitin ligase BIG BROTHER-related-like protein isoform X1 n=1 Tax=Cinnamomum micranthum f. kanehirae TaxID=337451 RepID=A0A3S4NVP1_9MAGN|nr:E3 ubiquitin ligase BIG BROTHER-related-like protein isoform X1 [Cinnamomum micranthum f. kanehirae]
MDNAKQDPKIPFSELGQVDSDFALAKILQDQERAFMMLATDRDDDGNDNDESEEDFIDDDDDDYNDEEYYLLEDEIQGTEQDLEDIEEVAEEEVDDHEEEHESQDPPESQDLSYEELTALGELVGKESRGLPKDAICAFSSSMYKRNDSNDECVICQGDYEEGEALVVLPCKHQYHADCINKWLQLSKVCPICSEEVSSPSHGGSNRGFTA